MLEKPSIIAPPPWTLCGKGVILLYRFQKEFIEKNGFLSDDLQKRFKGVIGSVILVDYNTSPVGAYQELLFIAGLFQFPQRKAFHISKIYVSTYESVWNGINNWGIPKELATFRWEKLANQWEYFSAIKEEVTFFNLELKPYGVPFYVNTAWLPFHFYQWRQNILLDTVPKAKGWAKLCKIRNLHVNPNYFPDITQQKLIGAIVVPRFTMVFPQPCEVSF